MHLGDRASGDQHERGLKAVTFDFGYVLTFGADSYCLDFQDWCKGIQAEFLSGFNEADFGSEEFGRAWANSNVLCYIAENVIQQSTSAMVAKGYFTIDHNNGETVKKIDMQTSINHVGLALANATAIASQNATAGGYAYAYTDSNDLCDVLSGDGAWGQYVCATSVSAGEVMGEAEAQGIATGASRAQVGGLGAQESTLYVEADSIDSFEATMTATAGNFAFASARATVDAVADAYLQAFAGSYAETCQLFIDQTCATACESQADPAACVETACSTESCDTGYATQNTNSTNVGEALGTALASSFDQALFTISTVASYSNIVGSSDIMEQITFGHEGKGYSGTDVVVECVQTPLVQTA